MSGDRITSVAWRRFAVPLRSPLVASWGETRMRPGFFVRVETANGTAGEGEASPLAGYVGGGLEETEQALARLARGALGRPLDDPWPALEALEGLSTGSTAAARCGLETAIGDATARAAGVPLRSLLAVRAGLPPGDRAASIPVNELIDATDPDDVSKAAAGAHAAGYPAIKIKVGGDPGSDAVRVGAARAAAGPEMELRVDANGGWSRGQAQLFLRLSRDSAIALCEEPVALGPGQLREMRELREECGVPLALDESCTGLEAMTTGSEAGAIDAVVLKPMVLGLGPALEMLAEAGGHGLRCIVTTTFDAGWGTMAAAQLAALLPEPRAACGLATLDRLEHSLVRGAPAVRRGHIQLPDGPGLGVSCDEPAFERHASGPGARFET